MSGRRFQMMQRREFLRAGLVAAVAGRVGRVFGAAETGPASQPASAPAEPLPMECVHGRVLYDGKPPVPAIIDCAVDPHCALLYRKEPLTEETLLVRQDGSLMNVFVSINKGLAQGRKWPVPDRPAVLDQKGCRYIPHVIGVMAGQPMEIVNSSKIQEVPHGYPRRNPEFSFNLPKRGMKETVVLAEPETFEIKCDVHPWELAWCHVMPHPFFSITDAAGRFVIQGLPPGEYELELQHEHASLQTETRTIRVEAGRRTAVGDVIFKPAAPRDHRRSRPARG